MMRATARGPRGMAQSRATARWLATCIGPGVPSGAVASKRCLALSGALLCGARAAHAAPPTHGYDEPVVQWGVQKGETCEDIARALYGSPKYTPLLQRYN